MTSCATCSMRSPAEKNVVQAVTFRRFSGYWWVEISACQARGVLPCLRSVDVHNVRRNCRADAPEGVCPRCVLGLGFDGVGRRRIVRIRWLPATGTESSGT